MSTRHLTSRRALLGVASGVLLLAGSALAGCSEPTATATDGGTVAPASAPVPPISGTGSSSSTTSKTSTPKPTTTAFPSNFITLDTTIRDTGLGHQIVVSRVLRALPWPAGYSASANAYELIAVEMTWTPSTDYTAPLRQQDFSIVTGSQYPNRPEHLVDAAMTAHGLTLLPTQVESGKSAKGWLVFKVDPKGAKSLQLAYTRPASQVTGSSQTFASKVFTGLLVS